MIKARDRLHRFVKGQEGVFTLEAMVILPFFLAFVLSLVSMIQLAVTQWALEAAAVETGKQIAAHWYPVRLLAEEAGSRFQGSTAGVWLADLTERVEQAKSKWTGAEEWVERYEAAIPEPIVRAVRWEKDRRTALEDRADNITENAIHSVTDPLLCRAFLPVVLHFANGRFLAGDRLQVERVGLPSLLGGGDPHFELVVSYPVRLPVPWWNKPVILRAKVYERAWVGR